LDKRPFFNLTLFLNVAYFNPSIFLAPQIQQCSQIEK